MIRIPRRNRSVFLLVSLVLIVGFTPFLAARPVMSIVGNLLLCLIPITGVLAVSDNRRDMIVGTILGIPTLIAVIHGTFFSGGAYTGAHAVVVLVYYGAATVMILRRLFRLQRVTVETLSSAASAYLLVGVTFALAYAALSAQDPNAFTMGGVPGITGFEVSIYYSFVTLTTLGYGDILPVSHAARTLAIFESICGVLYLGMIIARMVGMYQAPSTSDEGA